MSTDRLGRAKNLDKYWSESLLDSSQGRIEIKEHESKQVESLSVIDEYPYEGQISLSGEFIYHIPARKGDTVTRRAEYEFRTASGLFLIDTSIDRIKPGKIISEINRTVAGNASISESIQISRENFWNLLVQAETIKELKVRDKEGVYDAADLLRVVNAENPDEKLDEIEQETGQSIESLRKTASRLSPTNGSASLKDLELDLNSLNIQNAKAIYWYGSYPATLEFQKGLLWVDAENDVAREYVIQLFERDIIYPSYE